MNVCNIENTWGGFFGGMLPLDQGFVAFQIFNQAPATKEDDDGSADFALLTQMADGLGNAAEGDKYHFRWETILVDTGATAQGHGFLFVMPSSAMFVVAGHGDHPAYGSFNLTGEGDVVCFGGEGTGADGMFHLRFDNDMTDDGAVELARCASRETCSGD